MLWPEKSDIFSTEKAMQKIDFHHRSILFTIIFENFLCMTKIISLKQLFNISFLFYFAF